MAFLFGANDFLIPRHPPVPKGSPRDLTGGSTEKDFMVILVDSPIPAAEQVRYGAGKSLRDPLVPKRPLSQGDPLGTGRGLGNDSKNTTDHRQIN